MPVGLSLSTYQAVSQSHYIVGVPTADRPSIAYAKRRSLPPAPSFLPRRLAGRALVSSLEEGEQISHGSAAAVGVYVCRVRVSPFGHVPRLEISARVGVEESDNMYS